MPPGRCGYFASGSAAILLIYALITVIHRLYFSPLAGFPGPRIAAATGWYEFYFDIIKRGSYIYEIEKMHHTYGNNRNIVLATLSSFQTYLIFSGPIIRINPYELVIHDPDFYSDLYVTGSTRRTDIWPRYRTGIGFDGYTHRRT